MFVLVWSVEILSVLPSDSKVTFLSLNMFDMKFDKICEFFERIEKDPSAIVNNMTVRDYLMAKAHIYECQKCSDSVDRVLAKHKHEGDGNTIGFNIN